MGLFKSAVNIGLAPITGGASLFKFNGKSAGDIVSKNLGLDKNAPQFNPDIKQLEEDIQAVRDVRDTEPEEIRKSSQIVLDQAGEDLQQAQGQLQAGSMGRFRAMQDAIAESGGLDSGTTERLARNAQREATLGQQGALDTFGGLRSNIMAGDFERQESLRDRALFTLPQFSSGVAQIQNQAAAANMQARALMDANNKAKSGMLGSLAGMGVGAALGGPTGAMIGGGVGRGLFSMF